MVTTISLLPGVTLRHIADHRFRQGCLSLQLLRPMAETEAAANALIPAVLLRGCQSYRDLRAITLRLDDLYGASVGALVRRIGDWQTTGFYCGFLADGYAMAGDTILEPMIDLVRQLMTQPLFDPEHVENEKTNLMATIESNLNDKRAYAMEQLLKAMCRHDSFGIPRLGNREDVQALTAQGLKAHWEKILRESPMEICYVGAAEADKVAQLLKAALGGLERCPVTLPPQTGFAGGLTGEFTETMEVSQGKLCMGFATPITIRDRDFAAVQMLNMIFGGGMTSKLFSQIREKQSLCYAIGSGCHGTKGILTVSAGIDSSKKEAVEAEIQHQLQLCRDGSITETEMEAARQALRTSLQATADSPGALEGYYATAALSGLNKTPEEYIRAVEAVTKADVMAAARSLRWKTTFFLQGVTA